MGTPFKMKGFSGFGSPLKQELTRKQKKAQKKEQKMYNQMLEDLNVSASDTLVTGSSVDQATAKKKALANYRAAHSIDSPRINPITDEDYAYDRKTKKYTAYVKGKNPR
tara:strand:- start:241 stop:567 length:327 start_codon:yes stop_codon:yes gene_type:complete